MILNTPNILGAWQTEGMSVTFTLPEFLKQHSVTAYRLERELKGQLSRNTVYDLCRPGSAKQIDLATLGKVVNVLSAILGRPVQPGELFAFTPEPHQLGPSASGLPYTGHLATDMVLDRVPDLQDRLRQAADPH